MYILSGKKLKRVILIISSMECITVDVFTVIFEHCAEYRFIVPFVIPTISKSMQVLFERYLSSRNIVRSADSEKHMHGRIDRTYINMGFNETMYYYCCLGQLVCFATFDHKNAIKMIFVDQGSYSIYAAAHNETAEIRHLCRTVGTVGLQTGVAIWDKEHSPDTDIHTICSMYYKKLSR